MVAAFFSYLILAIFFAISLYTLVGMVYMGFKTWKEDKAKVRKISSKYGSNPEDDTHLIAS